VNHLRDAASWYWPGRMSWYEPFARRGVRSSKPDATEAVGRASGGGPSSPGPTEAKQARSPNGLFASGWGQEAGKDGRDGPGR
jgi:hypothetical protein